MSERVQLEERQREGEPGGQMVDVRLALAGMWSVDAATGRVEKTPIEICPSMLEWAGAAEFAGVDARDEEHRYMYADENLGAVEALTFAEYAAKPEAWRATRYLLRAAGEQGGGGGVPTPPEFPPYSVGYFLACPESCVETAQSGGGGGGGGGVRGIRTVRLSKTLAALLSTSPDLVARFSATAEKLLDGQYLESNYGVHALDLQNRTALLAGAVDATSQRPEFEWTRYLHDDALEGAPWWARDTALGRVHAIAGKGDREVRSFLADLARSCGFHTTEISVAAMDRPQRTATAATAAAAAAAVTGSTQGLASIRLPVRSVAGAPPCGSEGWRGRGCPGGQIQAIRITGGGGGGCAKLPRRALHVTVSLLRTAAVDLAENSRRAQAQPLPTDMRRAVSGLAAQRVLSASPLGVLLYAISITETSKSQHRSEGCSFKRNYFLKV